MRLPDVRFFTVNFLLSVCFLLNLAARLGTEDFAAAVNIHDLVETSVSAFAQLLLSKSKNESKNDDDSVPQEKLVQNSLIASLN